MSDIKLVIFDLDGTLIDTVSLVVNSLSAAFNHFGYIPPSEKEIRSISGLRIDIALRQLAPNLSNEQLNLVGEKYRQNYLHSALSANREPLFEGALELIDELSRRDNFLMAIATGKPMAGTKRILKEHNIINYFSSLQTPDNNKSKPNPQMIYSAMEKVGAKKENSLMIGDTVHDMHLAKNANVKSIAVGWGYHTKEELIKAGADSFTDRFDNLLKKIDGFIYA